MGRLKAPLVPPVPRIVYAGARTQTRNGRFYQADDATRLLLHLRHRGIHSFRDDARIGQVAQRLLGAL